MNAKLIFALTAAATTVAVSTFSAPANAFSFGNGGIKFDTDTTVSFKFSESHGAYQSTLGIFEALNNTKVFDLFQEVKASDNGAVDDYKGTYGNTVLGSNPVSFTFKGGVEYALGLVSTYNGNSAGTVFSTDNLNSGSTQQALFSSDNPFNSIVNIRFDDRGNANDKDFNDFTVSAQAVPEPLTMGGIALAGAGLAYARRKRQSNNA